MTTYMKLTFSILFLLATAGMVWGDGPAKMVPPARASKPAGEMYAAKVDAIIVNHHRSYCATERRNLLGEPYEVYSVTVNRWCVWVELIDRPWTPKSKVRNRGWGRLSECHISPCSDGWVCEYRGLFIVAAELWILDSPYDYDLNHRAAYDPLRKP